MRVLKFFMVLLVVALFIPFFGCDPCLAPYPGAIAKVKSTILLSGTEWNPGGVTVEESINTLVGARGDINWGTINNPVFGDQEQEYPDVIVVEAHLTKRDKEGELHHLIIQYLFNKKTKVVEQNYIELDSEPNIMGMLEFQILDY